MKKLILVLIIFFTSAQSKATSNATHFYPQKIITITVNQKSLAFIGRDTLTMDQVTDELQKRLWKSYLGTGKMYDAIQLEFVNDTQAGVMTNARNAIHEAQNKVLIDVCLQKHKKLFEGLGDRQQRKIKNQFPVLFQAI